MLIFKILTNRRKLQLVSYQNEGLDFPLCLIHFYISYSNWDGLWTVFTKQAFSQFAFTYVTRCAVMEWKQEKTEGSRKSTVCSGLVTENRVEPSNTLKKTIQFERYPFSRLIRILLSKQKCVVLIKHGGSNMPQFEHRDVISLSFEILQIFNRRGRSIILHIRCVS